MIRNAMLLITLLLAAHSAPAFAEDKPFIPLPLPSFDGTPEEQKACRPDVVRLCSDTVQDQHPDQQRILACLQRNRAGLKQPCRTVLQNHGV
jgi:hypothetical protein